MESRELVQQYYTSLAKKDDTWQKLYTEDAIFTDASHLLVANGRGAIIQSFSTFLKGVKKVTVKQLITENETVCAIVCYDYINRNGETMTQDDAEVWTVKDRKLTSLTIYFDITAYREFMKR